MITRIIGCEKSGVVREAFKAVGCDAWSCDLMPTEIPGQHLQCDILDVLDRDWDIGIMHPECTDLAVSGAPHFPKKIADGRQPRAIKFFMKLANAPIHHLCIENPVSIMSTKWRKPDQIIQPHYFGHDASKTTCLWLKNLPLLTKGVYVEPRIVNGRKRWANQCDSGQNKLGPSVDRSAKRAETYAGIAKAMAEQWTAHVGSTRSVVFEDF